MFVRSIVYWKASIKRVGGVVYGVVLHTARECGGNKMGQIWEKIFRLLECHSGETEWGERMEG